MSYKIIKTLGKGKYGTVVLANSEKYGKVAIKTSTATSLADYNINLNEVKILETITKDGLCPWIIKIYEHTRLDGTSLRIVMEYFEAFSLNDIKLIWTADKADESYSRWAVVKNELLNAVSCLHKKYNIVHRDIKLENCMFDEKQFKLVDFGFACYIDDLDKKKHCQILAGTPYYMSPEAIDADRDKRKPTWDELRASDIWAVGQTLFALAHRRKLFELPGTNMKILEGRIRENTPEKYLQQARSLGKWTDEVHRIVLMLSEFDIKKRQDNFEQLLVEAIVVEA
jgi:serine/threonine protein kinase